MLGKLAKISKLVPVLIILILILIISSIKVLFHLNKDKPSDYFPDAIMVKSFKGELDNDEFIQIIDKVQNNKVQIKQINNYYKVVMVYDTTDKVVRLVYTSQEEEFNDDYISNLRENRDDIIIKGPLKVGNSWQDDIGGVYEIIEIDSIVKTSVGKFEAILVEYNNGQLNVKEYYAKNTGLIKIIINNYIVNELVDIERKN